MVKEIGWTGEFADGGTSDFPERQENRKVRANRLYVDFLVTVTTQGRPIQGFTLALNLSWSGMLLATNYPLQAGDRIHLDFSLPRGDIPVAAHARVVHVQESDRPEEASYFGVKFENIDPSTQRLLEAYVLENLPNN